MGEINREDVVGYFSGTNGHVLCADCFPDNWENDALGHELLTRQKIEDGDSLFYCDACGKIV